MKNLLPWITYILIALVSILFTAAVFIIIDPNLSMLPAYGDAFNILSTGVAIAALMAFLRTINQQKTLIEQNAEMIKLQKEELALNREELKRTAYAQSDMLKLQYLKELLIKLNAKKSIKVEEIVDTQKLLGFTNWEDPFVIIPKFPYLREHRIQDLKSSKASLTKLIDEIEKIEKEFENLVKLNFGEDKVGVGWTIDGKFIHYD
jgi:prefoldin subunit 5